jgi:hypothetical protein
MSDGLTEMVRDITSSKINSINETSPEECDEIAPSMYLKKQNAVDMVNHPPHYQKGTFELIEILEVLFPREPLLWQTVKYLGRWEDKGDPLENLEKSEYYLKRKIAELKRKTAELKGL